jgi:disulfide bond formation protein DsbB
MNAEPSKDPTPETLRQQLDIQWQDHFQTREQTWKALQMVAVLFVGYIGAGLKADNPWLIWAGGVVCILAACFGIAVTIHHRKVQITKHTFIHRLEDKLGLHRDDLLAEVGAPSPFRWAGILNFRHMATPTFILLMHVAILALAAIYMFARLRV